MTEMRAGMSCDIGKTAPAGVAGVERRHVR